jgi:probable F420-dependent oxidoreductase
MELGLALPQFGCLADPSTVRTVAIAAERAGYSSLWALDRPLASGAALDPIVALTMAASVTEHVRVGTDVLIAPLYSPLMLARTAATLDRVSDGRFTLGLGLGASSADYAAVGVPHDDLQARIEQMLEVMARVWRDEIVEIETTRERIPPTAISLKPSARRVPLLLAEHTPAGLERIARRADGWAAFGLSTDDIVERWAEIRRIATQYGRDPESLRLVVRADVKLSIACLGKRREFAGSVAQVRDDIERVRDAGAHELILDLHSSASTAAGLLDLAASLSDVDAHCSAA